MNSVFPLLTAFAIYLWLVFKVLPKFMESRKPFNLLMPIRCYNIFQIVACTYFILKGHVHGFSFDITFKCIQMKDNDIISKDLMEILKLQHLFVYLRLLEFLETIFFVLRKKSNQVSMLHVYHHMSTVALLWLHIKFSGGFMDAYLGAVNSAVHVIMYSYYFLSSFKQFVKFTNYVKPFLTAIQIIQLVVLFGQCIVALLPGCNASKVFAVQLANIAFLIFMFVKFFIKSNKKSNKKE